jgi:hypothetical protein
MALTVIYEVNKAIWRHNSETIVIFEPQSNYKYNPLSASLIVECIS